MGQWPCWSNDTSLDHSTYYLGDVGFLFIYLFIIQVRGNGVYLVVMSFSKKKKKVVMYIFKPNLKKKLKKKLHRWNPLFNVCLD